MSGISADLCEAVIALASDASAAIMGVYADNFEVEHKADNSPLTRADLAAHRIIAAGLSQLTPSVPSLSEEGADIPWSTRQQWNTYWLVDPLDGTREFVKRNGEFTVNIALIEAGRPVFGVIMAPVTGVIWYAEAGRGAWRRDESGERELHTRQPATAPLKVAVSRSHRDPSTQAVLERLPGAEAVPLGSSLKFCYIAEGALDVYPRFGPTCEWDTGAGQCILEAAGGALLSPAGSAFAYNRRDSLINGDFMALGDVSLPWREWLG